MHPKTENGLNILGGNQVPIKLKRGGGAEKKRHGHDVVPDLIDNMQTALHIGKWITFSAVEIFKYKWIWGTSKGIPEK